MPLHMPLVLTFLAVIWGVNFIFVKWAVEYLEPSQVVLVRLILGFAVVLIFALATRQLSRSQLRHWPHFLVMSCLAGALYYYLFTVGTDLLPSGIAGAISGGVPIFALIASLMFLGDEPVTKKKVISIMIGFAGILLLSRPFESAAGDISLAGVGYMVAGSLSLGSSFAYARRFITPLKLGAGALTTYQLGFAIVIQALFTDLSGVSAITEDSRALWSLIVGLGILGTGGAYVGYYYVVDKLGAVKASAVTYISPVVALFVGAFFVHEPIIWVDYLATALILWAVVMLREKSDLRVQDSESTGR